MRIFLPPTSPGLGVGLFGGSFNPPHEGHRLVAETALRRLGLDQVWWIVTPGNPLKSNSELPSQAERMALVRDLVGADRRMVVTGIEAEIGTRYTEQTIRFLRSRLPQVNFVWLMGADNLADFHRWKNWRNIAGLVPMAIIDRPGATLKAASSPAARMLARFRIDESDGRILPRLAAPRWLFLHGKRSPQSSTALREKAQARHWAPDPREGGQRR
ncbi:MAG: nicotinate-nucleotide adenylyltransferase [Methylobacterium sp.]|nr:nicotinate-nucleotide adenylyltransferase [Methylobacterium sp.]MCA3664377.1 nicotinate-nucleotide adenylyltransferase [Methylobacterium sp.]MCA3666937.1 nicotinate-nucleotide adenylyltransferase [Methylobacterium sp.]MCA3672080.1 nicotinate-nucleotide adenylyltransferase [Methylobacterium sp.]MCA3677003.1 nicotinate-nucleotide adenylyltransferase [Methylobacterium sp.]